MEQRSLAFYSQERAIFHHRLRCAAADVRIVSQRAERGERILRVEVAVLALCADNLKGEP